MLKNVISNCSKGKRGNLHSSPVPKRAWLIIIFSFSANDLAMLYYIPPRENYRQNVNLWISFTQVLCSDYVIIKFCLELLVLFLEGEGT